MGAIRDAAATQARILDAALDEFGRDGIAGARVDRIARAARVNKRMLYHYFSDKAGLYAATLAHALAAGDEDTSTAGLAERLDALQQRYASDPARARLLMWEALASERAVVAEEERGNAWRARVDRVRAAQASGRLAFACDAAHLELALVALALFPFAFPQLTRLIAGHAPDAPEFRAAQRVLFRALAKRLESAAPPESRDPEIAPASSAKPKEKPRYRLTATVT
jgi:AcrR family transcriptional regulator